MSLNLFSTTDRDIKTFNRCVCVCVCVRLFLKMYLKNVRKIDRFLGDESCEHKAHHLLWDGQKRRENLVIKAGSVLSESSGIFFFFGNVSDYSYNTLKGVERSGMAKYIFSLCVESLIIGVWVWTGCTGFSSFRAHQITQEAALIQKTEPLAQHLVIYLFFLLTHSSWYHHENRFQNHERRR